MILLRVIGLLVGIVVVFASWMLTCAAWQTDNVTAGVVPLDARSWEVFTVLTIGTGGGYENPNRLGPSTAIAHGDHVVLVDAGRGVSESLRRARIPTSQPRTIYLTSLMPENTVGLDDLLMTGWLDGRQAPLRVVGPPGTAALVDGLLQAHETAIRVQIEALALPAQGARLLAEEIESSWQESLDGLQIEAIPLLGGPTLGLAWRFVADGKTVVVGTSAWGSTALIQFAKGADMLIHEAAFVPTPEIAAEIGLDVDPERLQRERRLHTPLESIGELAQRAQVGTLVLVRLRPPPVYDVQITMIVNDSYDGEIVIADDGDELTP